MKPSLKRHKHDNPVASPNCAYVGMSTIHVTMRLEKSTDQQAIPQQNTLNTTRFYACEKNQ